MTAKKKIGKGLCFVISPIGEEGTKSREQSDKIFKTIIKPAAQKCGYEVKRSDILSKPGIITAQIIQHLTEDPLVIADLTGQNPNVLYELAIRHLFRKPVVQIMKNGGIIPFDVRPVRTIFFDYDTPTNINKCKNEIVRQTRVVETDPSQVDMPFVSTAFPDTKFYANDREINKYMLKLVSSGSTLDIVSNRLHWIHQDRNIKLKLITRAKKGVKINIYIPKPNAVSIELAKKGVKIHICPNLGNSPHPRFTIVNKDRPGAARLAIASGSTPNFAISEFTENAFAQVVAMAREYVNTLKASSEIA